MENHFENEFKIKKVDNSSKNVISFNKDISSQYSIEDSNGKSIKRIDLYPNRQYFLSSVNSDVVLEVEFKTNSKGDIVKK
ncbi:hypothetical protein PG275_10245 [Riemerella anatipestifer]|uniref:hypothetical protein n=1 Tax=Riemerella anatipestifer TaxID=34085 RepID=UPI002A875659|nr:hypothetical protein [Riemerella anatipestifer]